MSTGSASFRTILRHREFRLVWLAGMQSQIGDQLARVALSVLAYGRTGSGLAAAAVYALTYLPALAGGLLLSGLADRYPRRALLVMCDVLRAVLFAVMSLPSLPLLVVCVLLAVAVFIGSPYKAAEPAVVADMFDGDLYSAAIGLRTATAQSAQLAGFGVGGFVIAVIGARAALAFDAATFLVAATLLRTGLMRRPAVPGSGLRGWARVKAGFGVVASNRELRILLGFSWLAGWWIVPEGLATAYAAAHGGGAASVGLLLAANPAGNLIGAVLLSRWLSASARARLLGPMAIASGVPLVICSVNPGTLIAVILWGLTGLFSAYQVQIVTEFVALVPSHLRGQAIGLAGSGLLAAQGIGLLIGGGIDQAWSVAPAVAVSGAAGALLAVALTRARSRAQPRPT